MKISLNTSPRRNWFDAEITPFPAAEKPVLEGGIHFEHQYSVMTASRNWLIKMLAGYDKPTENAALLNIYIFK